MEDEDESKNPIRRLVDQANQYNDIANIG